MVAEISSSAKSGYQRTWAIEGRGVPSLLPGSGRSGKAATPAQPQLGQVIHTVPLGMEKSGDLSIEIYRQLDRSYAYLR